MDKSDARRDVSDRDQNTSFFYPVLFLVPAFEDAAIDYVPFRIAKRKWGTSTFDLATLATKHKLHLPYQAMDMFLSRCKMELCVTGKRSLEEANQSFQSLRISLYSTGVSPFICPFVTTYSVNDYSGINSRDSDTLRATLHPGMEVGLTSDAGMLEAWPLELSFQCSIIPDGLQVSEANFVAAARIANLWEPLRLRFPQLQAVINAATTAPTIGTLSQSLLHIWTGMEALFPSVSTELSFKLALYIAQLTDTGTDRLACFKSVRSAYNTRSRIAHGNENTVTAQDWNQTWAILMKCLNALYRREHLPTEDDLLREMLS